MSLDLKYYVLTGLAGAVSGLCATSISALSGALINVHLGFSPLSIKNTLKVCLISAATPVGIVAIVDGFKPVKDIIKEEILPEPAVGPSDKF